MSDAFLNLTPKPTAPVAKPAVGKEDEPTTRANPPLTSENPAKPVATTPGAGKPSQAEADFAKNQAFAAMNMAKNNATNAAGPTTLNMAQILASTSLSPGTMKGLQRGEFGGTARALEGEGIRAGKKLSTGAFDALSEAVAFNLANRDDDGSV